MPVSFYVQFHEHLSAETTSNLKGILLSQGTDRGGKETFILDVHREKRVSFTAITLNNWVAYGWVSSWESKPPLMQD